MVKTKYKLVQPNHVSDGKRVPVGTIIELTEKQAAGLINKVELIGEAEPEVVPFNPETDKPTKSDEFRAVLELRGLEIPEGVKAADLKELWKQSEEDLV